MDNTQRPGGVRKPRSRSALETTKPLFTYVQGDEDVEDLDNGEIDDVISGLPVRETPEEIDAVQVFAERLIKDYGYNSEQVQTHPQFRVKRSPSDKGKTYPVDIAVFKDGTHTDDHLFMIVECKRHERKDGVDQLKLYMDMSAAEVGVWFNGLQHVYLNKQFVRSGGVKYSELPTIPRRDQRIEDIGLFVRGKLQSPSNLKSVFVDIRNSLASQMAQGMSRDEALAQEIINLLFCKIYDELNTGVNEAVSFRAGMGETAGAVKKRILGIFEEVKRTYRDVFVADDKIKLDAESIRYVVGELQNYAITSANRDAIGDAFEVFIGPALRGADGQFFTPRNVVRAIVDMVDPKPGEMVIDPACGSGGFLIAALENVWKHLEDEAVDKGWGAVLLDRKKRDVASECFRGIDKDSFLAKVTKAYMAIIGDGKGGIFCENSLQDVNKWTAQARDSIRLGEFDVVLTNPPFGSKIKIRGADVLSQYQLAHKWHKQKDSDEFLEDSVLVDSQPPQILFLERCLSLLKPGGRLGIVLPESLFGMPKYEFVVAYLLEHFRVKGIVALPEALFKTSGKIGTHTKTCIVLIENSPPNPRMDDEVFMADAEWCGHDSRGNPTERANSSGEMAVLDDVPRIASEFKELMGPWPR